MVAEVIPIGGAKVTIDADLRPLDKGLEEAKNKTKSAASGMAKSFKQFKAGVDRATSAVVSLKGALATVGIALSIRKTVDAFAEFQKGLIGVGKTADLSGQDLEDLGKDIQAIAREVPVATTELLAIAQAAGQLGVKGSENILAFVSTVGKLGLASDLAGEEAATSLARILTVVKEPTSNVDRLGAAIVALGNNFAATESEIAEVATRVARSTAEFDTTSAEVAGIATALKAVGVQAEEGGTVLGKAFRAMKAAIRDGGEELVNLQRITGKSADQLAKQYGENATSVLIDFVQGLGRIKDEGGDVSPALESIGLQGERVFSVFGTLSKRSDVLAEAIELSNKSFEENAALNKEAAVAAESFSSQMQIVANVVDEAAAEIGRELAPVIIDITTDFRNWLIQARETGELAEIGESIAGAFKKVADNLDLITVAATTLIGSRIFAVFGPWGAAAGVAAGLVAGLVITVDDFEDVAEDASDDAQTLTSNLRKFADINKRAAESSGTAQKRLKEESDALRRLNEDLAQNILVTRSAIAARIEAGGGADVDTPAQQALVLQLRELDNALRSFVATSDGSNQAFIDTIRNIVGVGEQSKASARAIDGMREALDDAKDDDGEDDGIKRLTEDQKAAIETVDDLIASLRDEAEALSVATNEREAHEAILRAENILAKEGLKLDEDRRETIRTLAQSITELNRVEDERKEALADANRLIEETLTAEERRDEKIQEAIDLLPTLEDALGSQAEAWKVVNRAIKEARDEYNDFVEDQKKLQEEIKTTGDVIEENVTRGLRRNIDSWQDLRDVAIDVIQDILIDLIELESELRKTGEGTTILTSLFDAILGASPARTSSFESILSSPDVVAATGSGPLPFQHGGRFRRGDIGLVGEAGPEIVAFDGAGTVIPNSALSSLSITDTSNLDDPRIGAQQIVNFNGPTNKDNVKNSLPQLRRAGRIFLATGVTR